MSRKDWTQSFSDLVITPRDLKPEQVRFDDIAHALAGKNRFSCQSKRYYNVAQHCVLGARLLPYAFKLPFLLHEVSEVYLPDIPAPLKPYLSVTIDDHGGTICWTTLESLHADAILEALGLSSIRPLLDSPEVKRMDAAMLLAEKAQLMGPEPEPWNIPGEAAPVFIGQPWTPEDSAHEFRKLFYELTSGFDANGSPVP